MCSCDCLLHRHEMDWLQKSDSLAGVHVTVSDSMYRLHISDR